MRSVSPGSPPLVQQAYHQVQIALNSPLKIGQFSFSQQDLVIPVAGIPLSVIRTYNSLNPNPGDFGFSWTYAIKDMEVTFNEEREPSEDFDGTIFSMRVGAAFSGRDVTVTMPDGRRATFVFKLLPPLSSDPFKYRAVWDPPPGVYASLRPTVSNKLIVLPGGLTYWEAAGLSTPLENFDFRGFVLTTADGTQYGISREDLGEHFIIDDEGRGAFVHAYGDGRLSQIALRDGNTLTFTEDGIIHSAGKSIVFHRDGQNRIDAIYDPNSGAVVGQMPPPGVAPAMKYEYDQIGNLTKALRLISKTPSPQYSTNEYIYGNSRFPHYITEIKDPRGISPLRNLYDDFGRLIGVVDAFGKTNSFTHDIANRTETITDRMGFQTVHIYDERGNVTQTVDAEGGVVARTFDANNNVLTESNAVGVTSYTYDAKGNRTSITDPLTNTTVFVYDGFGNVTAITNALGQVTRNEYDGVGNLLRTIQELDGGPPIVTRYEYDGAGNRTREEDASGNVTRYFYDSSGNLTNVVDALGHSTAYTYDANGNQLTETTTRTKADSTIETLVTTHIYDAQNRLIKTIDPLGFTNEVVYNEIGQQGATIDKLGRATSYDYDAMGRLERVTYPDDTFEEYGYDAEGRRIAMADRAGRGTTNSYDAVGRLILTIHPDGATVSNTYDVVGRLIATTDARTNTTTYVYDAAGRRTAVTNALQQVTKFDYDATGNLLKTTDALGRVVSNVYDSLNRRIKVVYPPASTGENSTFSETKYDVLGRRIAEIDQAGITNWFGYDALGRLTSVTNALNKVTCYEYDELGNLMRQIDANSHTNKFEYDKLGRRTKRTLPLGMSETFAYDAAGNLVTNVDFNGRTNTFVYDAMNRLREKRPDVAFGQSPITFTYYPTGVRSTMVDNVGTTSYTYDNRNRLTNKSIVAQASSLSLSYAYDFNGNLTKIQSGTANGTLVNYEYDKLNRLARVTDTHRGQNLVTTNSYDAVGNLAGYHYPNGVDTIYRYNSLNRLTNMTINAGSQLAKYNYTLGPSGNRTAISEVIQSRTRQIAYGYDKLYRLTNETIVADSVGPTGNIGYTYDDVGNRLSRTSTGAVATPVPSASYSYDTNDRLNSDFYDKNGNTTNSAGNVDRYDFENRLTNRNSNVFYVYDGDGHRVRKTAGGTNTFYLVDDRNLTGYAQVLEEFTSIGGGATNLTRVYTYGHDLISQDRFNGSSWALSFYGYDGHGNVRLLTDSGGTVTDTYTYDAFGNLIHSTGSTPNNYLYTGEQYDPNLGFYYLRARYMNPGTGRFWTMDLWEGNPFEPLSLHKYLYAHADPINGIDPSGRFYLISELYGLTVQLYLRTTTFIAAHPIIAGAIGLAINLVIPEEVDEALIGSGIPGFQGLSAVRRGELRFLKAIKNSRVSSWLTASARGLLSNKVGHAFERFAERVLFRGAETQVQTVGKRSLDFRWRGRWIELKTKTYLDADDLKQLEAGAQRAAHEAEDLVYFFLEKPTPSTVDKIEDVGGHVLYFFD